jgi:DNA-binding XRE family transcriptional regulator
MTEAYDAGQGAARKRTMRELRAALQISQMEVARRTGLSLSGVQGVEYGWSTPSIIVAMKIAEALGVRADEIEWVHTPGPRSKKDAPRVA